MLRLLFRSKTTGEGRPTRLSTPRIPTSSGCSSVRSGPGTGPHKTRTFPDGHSFRNLGLDSRRLGWVVVKVCHEFGPVQVLCRAGIVPPHVRRILAGHFIPPSVQLGLRYENVPTSASVASSSSSWAPIPMLKWFIVDVSRFVASSKGRHQRRAGVLGTV